MIVEQKELVLEQLATKGFFKCLILMAKLQIIFYKKNEIYIQRISAINIKIPFRSLSE